MKKLFVLFSCITMVMTTMVGFANPVSAATVVDGVEDMPATLTDDELVMAELEGCFAYFWNETNTVEGSPGYGLTKDNTMPGNEYYCSMAATGYAMAAYAIGAEYGFVPYEEAEERALKTLESIYENLDTVHGFFYHFYDSRTGERWEEVEVSGIDTTLFLAGSCVAAEYFGGEVKVAYEKIYDRVEWDWLVNPANNQFYMAYDEPWNPVDDSFSPGSWDVVAEQFIMYVMGAGSDTHPSNGDMFYSFNRWEAEYAGTEYLRSWANSLFAYQYSHAFIDFRNTVDEEGVNWYENSVNATIAARQYCIDNEDGSETYSENSWGLSACQGPEHYEGLYGAEPNGMPDVDEPVDKNDGTVAIYGAVASICFLPEESLAAMQNYYTNYPELWGPYGFYDSYNLDVEPDFYSDVYLGIDKGSSMVMLANYVSEFTWTYFMQNENVQQGMEACGIKSDVDGDAIADDVDPDDDNDTILDEVDENDASAMAPTKAEATVDSVDGADVSGQLAGYDLTKTAPVVVQPLHGTIVISETGAWTYTPDPGYVGVDSFSVTYFNGTEVVECTININVAADASLIDTDGDGFTDEVEIAEGTDPLDATSFPVDDPTPTTDPSETNPETSGTAGLMLYTGVTSLAAAGLAISRKRK